MVRVMEGKSWFRKSFKRFFRWPFGIVVFGWCFALIAVGATISFMILVLWLIPDYSFDEVARVSNGDIDAVLVERYDWMMISCNYDVFMLPVGAKLNDAQNANASFRQAFRGDHALGVNIMWRDKDTLAIEYLGAGSVVNPGQAVVGDQVIHIVSRSGITDETAPIGPMFHGLFRRGR
jgi:hypothetical protein